MDADKIVRLLDRVEELEDKLARTRVEDTIANSSPDAFYRIKQALAEWER